MEAKLLVSKGETKMNATAGGKNRLLVLATSTILVLALVLLASFMSIAGAQSEDPPLPSEITFIEGSSREIPAVDTVNLGPEWRPIFGENFESANWAAKWDVNLDIGSAGTGLKWGAQSIVNALEPSSTKSGWGICKDDTCSNVDPIAPNYPTGVKSFLVAGPFDFSRADDALVDLDLFYEANSADKFTVSVSDNRQTFVEELTVVGNINNGQWEEKSVSLSNYIGKDRIWIAFTFESNTAASKMGAMIDDISIWTKGEAGVFMPYIAYGFTPTPVPATPTATPQPGGGDFEQNFTNSINPWEARRWTTGTAYSVTHDGGSDDGRQGFLNVLVNTANSHYVIVSPLIAGPKPPYNIETMVKLRSDRNTGDQYGIIFGGNYTGGACPAPDFSTCFTQYYEMRVRFYYDQQLDRDRMEMKLKRIDSHNANNDNSGPDLIEWTRVKGVDENGFIEWDITVEANGKIKISANDQPVESATDSTYINNPYFGVIVRTEDEKDSEARFDYFKIDKIN
jgi:hypothetical protein